VARQWQRDGSSVKIPESREKNMAMTSLKEGRGAHDSVVVRHCAMSRKAAGSRPDEVN
jgi:hypothetical protein